MSFKIVIYSKEFEIKWDEFINKSLNGTFLQTRNFLSYHHKDKFEDNSLIIIKGENTIAAVIPACIINKENDKVFFSHMGSSFGGIVLAKEFYNIKSIIAILEVFDNYIEENDFTKVVLKNTSEIFVNENMALLNYFLLKNKYNSFDELSSYINLIKYKQDIISNFTASKRRDYKYSLKNNLKFLKLESYEEISGFHSILCDNLKKYHKKPVHSLEDLMNFKETRLKNIVDFYGVYYDEILVAGSMVFRFEKNVFHTQYLAADKNYLHLFTMNFLNTNLISLAKKQEFDYFSFGISTEDNGKYLNRNLVEFKEGFGSKYSLNKTYYKIIE